MQQKQNKKIEIDQSVFLRPNSCESQQEAASLGELWHTRKIFQRLFCVKAKFCE